MITSFLDSYRPKTREMKGLLNLKDGDDSRQMDEGRDVFEQTFNDDLSPQYFFKHLKTIFIEKKGESEFDF